MNKKKRNTRKIPNKARQSQMVLELINNKNSKDKKDTLFIRTIKNGWFWFSVISTLIAALQFKEIVINAFASDHESYEKEYFIKGIVLSDGFGGKSTGLTVRFGGGNIVNISPEDLLNGYDLWPIMLNVHIKPIHLYVKPKTRRLYVSSDIVDIQTGQIIGIINYNQWSLYKPNMLNYHTDDTAFEVLDRYNNVAFSMRYNDSNMLDIRGYFLYDSNALVISDRVVETFPYNNSNWRKDVINEVRTIKRIK